MLLDFIYSTFKTSRIWEPAGERSTFLRFDFKIQSNQSIWGFFGMKHKKVNIKIMFYSKRNNKNKL